MHRTPKRKGKKSFITGGGKLLLEHQVYILV
jgi:hypothetical protein